MVKSAASSTTAFVDFFGFHPPFVVLVVVVLVLGVVNVVGDCQEDRLFTAAGLVATGGFLSTTAGLRLAVVAVADELSSRFLQISTTLDRRGGTSAGGGCSGDVDASLNDEPPVVKVASSSGSSSSSF